MKIGKKTIKGLYVKIVKKISPIEITGGLSVSDSAIRYIRFNENGTIAEKASLRLPPEAVINGKIIKNDIVTGALDSLRNKISISRNLPVGTILSISSRSVYSHLFNLPQLEESSLAEAAELNIQMISPIDAKTSYHSYQIVGKPEFVTTGGYELLGAFIGKATVDDWIIACKKGGFLPIAVEFQTLSIVRAIIDFIGIRKEGTSLVLDVGSEGMNLIIVKNNNLYFDYFYSWKIIQGEDKSISIDKFNQVLIAETDKVMNFALSKFNGEIKSIWVNAEGIGEEMVLALRTQYPKLAISEIIIQEKKISPFWLSAIGAAKRGMLLRSEDDLISLNSQSVVKEYTENQTFMMIKLWRKISMVVLCFFLIVSYFSGLFLHRSQSAIKQQSLRSLSSEEVKELQFLRGQAKEFNSLVAFVSEARTQENKISPFLSKILNLGRNIQITRLSFQDLSQPIILNGTASSVSAIMEFQKQLSEIPNITEIQMPLADITATMDGRTTFVMSFRITSLNF